MKALSSMLIRVLFPLNALFYTKLFVTVNFQLVLRDLTLNKWLLTILFVAVAGVLGTAWLLKKRKQSTSKISLAQALVDRAKLLGRADLSRAELDEVFGIDKSAFEAQKVYRSRILKELSRQHPDLLRRERDPNDKRSYRYIIHHPDLSNRQN